VLVESLGYKAGRLFVLFDLPGLLPPLDFELNVDLEFWVDLELLVNLELLLNFELLLDFEF